MNGDDDGRFAPDRSVTRSEFAAILSRGLGLLSMMPDQLSFAFADIPMDGREYPAVQAASGFGLMNEFVDGSLKVGQLMTREQAVVTIYRAFVLMR